jgi:hypothetical protein
MASQDVGVEREAWERTINSFRHFYEVGRNSAEVAPVSIVAHHDDSLRFTNSTTSVMKPYLFQPETLPADRTYLVQPAMGSQGILAWRNREHIGAYASYFHSMGTLYPYELGQEAINEMTEIVTQVWGFKSDEIVFAISQRDTDIKMLLDIVGVDYSIDQDDDTSSFEHQYGHRDIVGRTANICILVNGKPTYLGDLTLIEHDDKPVAWEISFDSTNVIARQKGLQHPIDAYTHQCALKHTGSGRIAADALLVSSVLALEGLQPSSRGKNGILRKFFQTYVELVAPIYTVTDTIDRLVVAAETERDLRKNSLYSASQPSETKLDPETLKNWVKKFRPHS